MRRLLAPPLRPALRRLRLGALAGGRPQSDHWGRDRGTPVDRVYIEGFLAQHARDIRGDVLEVLDDTYARRFGSALGRVDVIDVDAANPGATLVADLASADALPAASYDCILLTQVLQYVALPTDALRHARRLLRPGGVLLLTVPAVARIDVRSGTPDLWRFTPAGVGRLLADAFPGGGVEVIGHGNLAVAAAFLHGLAAEEVAPSLAPRDERFPIVVTARAAAP